MCWSPNIQCDLTIFRDGTLWSYLRINEVIGWGPTSNKTSVLVWRERDTTPLSLSVCLSLSAHSRGKVRWGHSEKVIIPKPEREGVNPADTLILDFQPSERWENRRLFKHPSLWCIIMAAKADYCKSILHTAIRVILKNLKHRTVTSGHVTFCLNFQWLLIVIQM